MQHLGEFLKSERERKGIRLSDIASVTKIQIHNLKLIEEGNWKALPAKPFVKGFLTAYAKYIGVSSTEIYQRYLEETQPAAPSSMREDLTDPSSEVSESPLAEVTTQPKVLQIKPILISLFAVLFLGGSVWLIQLGKDSAAPEVAPVASNNESPQAPTVNAEPIVNQPVEAPREIASAPETASAPAPSPEAAVPAAPTSGHELEVNPKERTWVKIVIDDSPPVNLHLNPQERTKFSAKEKIKLFLGNSAGSEVFHNGTLTEGKKYSGTIRFYIFPTGARFPQDKPRQISNEQTVRQEMEVLPETNPETNLESAPE